MVLPASKPLARLLQWSLNVLLAFSLYFPISRRAFVKDIVLTCHHAYSAQNTRNNLKTFLWPNTYLTRWPQLMVFQTVHCCYSNANWVQPRCLGLTVSFA